MAALGSALSSQLRAPAPTAWKGKKQARAKRATPVRAASTENKIEEVAAAAGWAKAGAEAEAGLCAHFPVPPRAP